MISQSKVARRAAALCAAPAGVGFLLEAERERVPPDVAARPEVAVDLAAHAVWEIEPWKADHAELIADHRRQGPRLLGLARAVLSQAAADWWFDSRVPDPQEGLSPNGRPPRPDRLVDPALFDKRFERYAQKPSTGLFTSSPVGGTSAALAALTVFGDFQRDPPYIRYRLRVASGARVFVIDGPRAWYDLCARYSAAGEDGRLVPDWEAVAEDWDGVRLTLGGLLTAEQVRHEGPAGWTEHWGWDFEQTAWLRWAFDSVERLPDLAALPESPLDPYILRRTGCCSAPCDGCTTVDAPAPSAAAEQAPDAAVEK